MVSSGEALISEPQFGLQRSLQGQAPPDGEMRFCKHLDTSDGVNCALLGAACVLRATVVDIDILETCPVIS